MGALVTLARAKSQEYVIHDADDAEITAKIEEASAIVLDYIDDRENAIGWTVEDPLPAEGVAVPGVISAAVLLVFGALWENRDGGEDGPEPLSPAVKKLLRRYRDPVIA